MNRPFLSLWDMERNARMRIALLVVLALLFVCSAIKLSETVYTSHRDDAGTDIWKITQFAAEYRDLVTAAHMAELITRTSPYPDTVIAMAHLKMAFDRFDAGMRLAFAELDHHGLSPEFAALMTELHAGCIAMDAKIRAAKITPEFTRMMALLHQEAGALGEKVERLKREAQQDLLAKITAQRAQARYMNGAMIGLSATMLVLASLATGFALMLGREHAADHATPAQVTAQRGFLASMNHDMRTPLQGLRAALDLLRRQSLTGSALQLVKVAQQDCAEALRQTDQYLDNARPADMPVPALPHTPSRLEVRRNTALVVDDAEVNCTLVAQMLSALGFHVDVAFSGEDAVAQTARTAYGLILMDFQLPGMSGQDAAARIRSAGPSADAAIIGITAQIDAIGAAMTTGSFGHVLLKPFGLLELQSCLKIGPPLPDPGSFAPSADELALLSATLEMCGDTLGMALLQDTVNLATQALDEIAQDRSRCAETAHRAAGAALMAGFHELGAALRAIEQATTNQSDAAALDHLGENLALATEKAQATLSHIAAIRAQSADG